MHSAPRGAHIPHRYREIEAKANHGVTVKAKTDSTKAQISGEYPISLLSLIPEVFGMESVFPCRNT